MKNKEQNQHEIAMIPADAPSENGWDLQWVISKRQIELILHDVPVTPFGTGEESLARAEYRDTVLPVINLEQYFGLENKSALDKYNYIVTKVALSDKSLQRLMIRICNPISIRKTTFNATQAQQSGLYKHRENILGAFTVPENKILIIPDLSTICSDIQQFF